MSESTKKPHKAPARPAPQAPRVVLKQGTDVFGILNTLAAQLTAMESALTLLANSFTTITPAPPAPPPEKAPPRRYGQPATNQPE